MRSLAVGTMRSLAVVVLLAGIACARWPTAPRRPALVRPEIIVSLDGLTVHLFDRTTGASFVYAATAGGLRADGTSASPIGHFATGPDPADPWWYMPMRTQPAKYGGMPFLRLTATNPRGEHVYGIHGPVDGDASRAYLSRGCVRLAERDIRELFALVRAHPSVPVTIQQEVELDAAGVPVDVGSTPTLWPAHAAIRYGASVGPRAITAAAAPSSSPRPTPR